MCRKIYEHERRSTKTNEETSTIRAPTRKNTNTHDRRQGDVGRKVDDSRHVVYLFELQTTRTWLAHAVVAELHVGLDVLPRHVRPLHHGQRARHTPRPAARGGEGALRVVLQRVTGLQQVTNTSLRTVNTWLGPGDPARPSAGQRIQLALARVTFVCSIH